MERFGLGDRWAYRQSYSDKAWLGPCASRGEELLAGADAVLNVAGATRLAEEGLRAGRLIYLGTDPVIHEVGFSKGDEVARVIVEEHDDFATYGENIGVEGCSIPPLPGLRARTRQPVLMDLWDDGPPRRGDFTTVGNWQQAGCDVVFNGETYLWSKHHEFLKFLDLPSRTGQPLELATNLDGPDALDENRKESVPALGLQGEVRALLHAHGWKVIPATVFTLDPWEYRDYILASRGEFTVARDLNVRLRSGWFSERSACYLAAGRPVVTQDTGFGRVLPTGEGLFAFNSLDDVLTAFEMINADYERHSRAAREIAHDYFRAETVLAILLSDLGLS
jgi:hypothetical protein